MPHQRDSAQDIAHALNELVSSSTPDGQEMQDMVYNESKAVRNLRAFIAEGKIFASILKIPNTIRGYEGELFDGIFVDPDRAVPWSDRALGQYSVLQRYLWALDHSSLLALGWDVKSSRIRKRYGPEAGGLVQHSHALHSKGDSKSCPLYIIAFQEIDDDFALVPAECLPRPEASENESLRMFLELYCLTTSTRSRTPYWCMPFMTLSDTEVLRAQVRGIWHAARGRTSYTNVTTGVKLPRWQPHLASISDLLRLNKTATASQQMVLPLLTSLRKLGCEAELNPLAPLLFDFSITLPDGTKLWVEHKTSSLDLDIAADAARVWHFLLIDMTTEQHCAYLCVPRSAPCLSETLSDRLTEKTTTALFEHWGAKTAHDIIRIMSAHAREAVQAGCQAIETIAKAVLDRDIEVISLSSHLDHRSRTGAKSAIEPVRPVSFKRQPALCLKELDEDLLACCRKAGKHIAWRLDAGHAYADIVIGRWSWDENDRSHYDQGRMPREIWDPDVRTQPVVLLRCIPHATSDTDPYPTQWPIAISSEVGLLRPVEGSGPCLFVVGVTGDGKGRTMRSTYSSPQRLLTSSYALIPSAHTKMQEVRRRWSDGPLETHRGYFRPVYQSDLERYTVSTFSGPVRQGEGLLEGSAIKPLRTVVSVDEIFRTVDGILTGEGEIQLPGKVAVGAEEHRMHTAGDILQAQVTHGLVRISPYQDEKIAARRRSSRVADREMTDEVEDDTDGLVFQHDSDGSGQA